MNSRREQVWVGIFVLVAAALLIAAALSMSGVFSRGNIPHRAYFKFGGGLERGAVVRFGGMEAGNVRRLHMDPHDSTRIEVDFSVRPDIPLKVDSVAKITSLGVLGDNYLELTTGSRHAALAEPGSVVKSAEAVSFDDLSDMAADLEPMAKQVLQTLDQRLNELQVTLARTNDLLNDRNRANISAALSSVRSMLAEDQPKLLATLNNVQTASAQLTPLLGDLKRTTAQANNTLGHVDGVVLENRQGLRASVAQLQQTLVSASSVMDQLNRLLNYNTGNVDQLLVNVRITTQQLRELTEKLERRPYTLIRADNPRERKPGDAR
jgi:phospholipid/cholesterol/gamma-HCH transport system substrate-binding protein